MEVDDVCILGCLSNDPVIPADSKQLHDFSGKADVFLCVSRVPVTPAPSPSHTESSALLLLLWWLPAASHWKTGKFQSVHQEKRQGEVLTSFQNVCRGNRSVWQLVPLQWKLGKALGLFLEVGGFSIHFFMLSFFHAIPVLPAELQYWWLHGWAGQGKMPGIKICCSKAESSAFVLYLPWVQLPFSCARTVQRSPRCIHILIMHPTWRGSSGEPQSSFPGQLAACVNDVLLE